MDPPPPTSIATGATQPYGTSDGAHLQATAAEATATAKAESQQPNAASDVGAANARKRRASGAPGSRGVANLTPEQLAKKRANDREAQRAIRERTKSTIESLEQRIRELESQQPFQELQRALQERDRALAECDELRRRLGAVAGIVGGQHPGLHELATLTAQQAPLPPAASSQHSYGHHSGSPYEQQHLHPELRSPQSTKTTRTTPLSQVVYSASESTLRKWSPSLDRPANGLPRHESPPNRIPSPSHGERRGVNFLLEPNYRQQPSNLSSRNPVFHSSPGMDLPSYHRLTLHGDASCPLDSLLLDFHTSRRKMLRDGATQLEAIGPDYPVFSAMVAPGSHPEPHPVSALLIDILSKFPDISKLPEKVAVLYIMFLVMRWLICPCKGCYERLPEWCRPVPEQVERYHSAWCDYLPWPHMRKMIAMNESSIRFDDFFIPYCQTLSLNWHFPHDCILLATPSESLAPTVTMNPAFEHHLRNLENWSLGSDFQKTFPQLVNGTVRIKES